MIKPTYLHIFYKEVIESLKINKAFASARIYLYKKEKAKHIKHLTFPHLTLILTFKFYHLKVIFIKNLNHN
ncbi:hypothetical protein CAP47_02405 [Psychroflexus sp. S27]|nr:hypothetical protein CAP47_02405 [Psychroflexus sp. S27]